MKIDFEISDGTHTLRDALVLPDDDTLTEQQIEELKQKRFDDYIAIITAPTEEEITDGN